MKGRKVSCVGRNGREGFAVAVEVGHVGADAAADLLDRIEVIGDDAAVQQTLAVKGLFKAVALMEAVEVLDGLLETKCEQEANGDGGNVNEEVAPGVGGVRRGMDVDHAWPEESNFEDAAGPRGGMRTRYTVAVPMPENVCVAWYGDV